MKTGQYDLVIIGAGAAGLAAAISYGRTRCGGDSGMTAPVAIAYGRTQRDGADGCAAEGSDSAHPVQDCEMDNGNDVGRKARRDDPLQEMDRLDVRTGDRVLLLERNTEAGKKLLATGNGRCNLANRTAEGFQETVDFFESLGLLLTEDDQGRYYPMSRQAASVRDALVSEVERLGIELALGVKATSVKVMENSTRNESGRSTINVMDGSSENSKGSENSFVIMLEESHPATKGNLPAHGSQTVAQNSRGSQKKRWEKTALTERESHKLIRTKRLIIATGGQAGPQYGSVGDGYRFARRLGHCVHSTRPVLVPLVYPDDARQALAVLKGVRIRAEVVLLRDEGEGFSEDFGEAGRRIIAVDKGEVQFTGDGISGICIFNLSRYMRDDEDASGVARRGELLETDMSDVGDHAGQSNLGAGANSRRDAVSTDSPQTRRLYVHLDLAPEVSETALADLLLANRAAGLAGIVPAALADFIAERTEGAASAAHMIKHFEVPVSGTKGWKEAQVTSGGVMLEEIDASRMASRAIPGLYFAGEVLDFDGPSGGYNLDFAWHSGIRAGISAAFDFTLV